MGRRHWDWCWLPVWAMAIVGAPAEPGDRYVVSTGRERVSSESRAALMDAEATGWRSEVFHERIQGVLGQLGEALVAGEKLERFVAGGGKMVVRERPERVYESGGVELRRGSRSRECGIGEGIGVLREFLAGGAGSARFKQYRVSLNEGGGGETEALVFLRVEGDGDVRSRRSVWTIAWDGEDRIVSVEESGLDEVVARRREALFVDRTGDVVAGVGCDENVFEWGANRMTKAMLSESGRLLMGIALGDANGDGRDDVFCPQAEGMPNLYLLSVPGGGFEEIGREVGLDWLDRTASGLWVDFDNDGDQDLAVATSGLLVLMENAGGGRRFVRRASFRQQDSSALCAADYDSDGLVDLYIGNYLAEPGQTTVADPEMIYDAKEGGANRLYRNRGAFEFEDVTGAVGLDEGAIRLTLAASWGDYDGDGDQDLYVANDFGPNCLYRNDGERFEEVAEAAGADDPSTGMSVSWADVDLDGRMDVAVANMFSSAGNRVVPQARFREAADERLDVDRVGVLARGNALLMNRREGGFDERGTASGMGNTQWTWGMLFADLDNSMHPDLVAVNGFITGPDEEDL